MAIETGIRNKHADGSDNAISTRNVPFWTFLIEIFIFPYNVKVQGRVKLFHFFKM
jgi:hypothetical protein